MRAKFMPIHAALLRALRNHLLADESLAPWLDDNSPGSMLIEGFDAQPWASLTFEGHRHRLMLRLVGPQRGVEHALDRIEWHLDEGAIILPGHSVVELVVTATDAGFTPSGYGATMTIEALTILD